jgi:hypothetical protein
VLPRVTTVSREILVRTARLLKSIGKDRQLVKAAFLIDGLGKSRHGGIQPGGRETDGAEGVSDDFP